MSVLVATGSRSKERRSKVTGADQRLEAACLDVAHRLLVALAGHGLELHDVARTEEGHELLQISDLLPGIVDRHGRDAEHLVTAGAAHRIDAAEAATMADGELRRVGARAQILRNFDLPGALDHLVHEGQAGHETHHGDEPGGARMRRDEARRIGIAVDAGGIIEVGARRVLVALAKAHQRLAGPGIVVENRILDDAGLQRRIDRCGRCLERLDLGQEVVRAR